MTAWRLSLLAAACMLYVTGELFPVGALTEIAADLDTSEALVGSLLAIYAVIAGVSAIPLTRWARRFPRRPLLVTATSVLAASLLVSALAPNLLVLAVARGIAASTHGLFWSIIAPTAVSLSPPGAEGRATAWVFSGNAIALIAGAPATAAAAQAMGWRTTCLVMGLLTIVLAIVLRCALPGGESSVHETELPVAAASSTPVPRTRTPGVHVDSGGTAASPETSTLLARLPGAAREAWHSPVGRIALLTALLVTAHFLVYTYVAVIVQDAFGITGGDFVLLLTGYGIAGALGTVLGGFVSDIAPDRVLRGTGRLFAFALIALAALTLVSAELRWPPLVVLLTLAWGMAHSSLPTQLQAGIIRVEPARADTASAVYVTCFQLRIATGSAAGALVYAHASVAALVSAGALLALVGLGLVLGRGVTMERPAAHVGDRR